jgi:hypothetical protein
MKNIPHKCYMYWGGSGPMAEIMVFTVLSFHKYNPDWEIIIYRTKQTNDELGENSYVPIYDGKDYFYMVEALPYVKIIIIDVEEFGINKDAHSILGSDIFREIILHQEGGLYSDLDVIWLKSMDELINIDCIGDPNDFECTVTFSALTYGFHTVSVIISEKGSPFLLSLVEQQKTVKPPYIHLAFSTAMMLDMYPTLESIISKYPRVLSLQYKTFYPYSVSELEPLFLQNNLANIESKDVMCVHWFNGHRLSQDYVNEGFTRDCSMTTILKREGYI